MNQLIKEKGDEEMKEKILALVVIMMVGILAGCGNQAAQTTGQGTIDYKIGVVTPTLSTSEDEFRAADMMAKK